jgi:Na+/H+-dicarboxylate symporter
MPFTLQVLVGLVAGLALGIAASVSGAAWLRALPGAAEPVGLLFINAIRMTVVPLVAATLMAGVAGLRDTRAVGRLGARSIAIFLAGIAAAAAFAAALGYPAFARLQVDAAIAASLRAGVASVDVAEQVARTPSLTQWLIDLVPANPIKAAADGAILPLTIFSVLFGLALAQGKERPRKAALDVIQAVSDAMIAVVGWVLRVAPLGVFALAVPLGARMGVGAAGVLLYYIAVMSAISAAFIVVLYGIAVAAGRQRLGPFVRASAPAVAVAFTSRSSLAALPATIDGVRALRLPEEMTSFYLPLAASMFRTGAAIAQVLAVLFVARLYGVALAPAQLGTVVLSVVMTTLTVPGIPAGAIIVLAPVLSSVGLPVEGIALLMGVDTIPDMFRTTANVVGWMAGATLLGRRPQQS